MYKRQVISALLVHALNYSYWKPVQAGTPTDSNYIREKVPHAKVYPEGYMLNTPCSPHEAAKIDGINISIDQLQCPQEDNLIIEGAGGVMVPVNYNGDYLIDIIRQLNFECVVVSNHYLGSINHTTLTIKALQAEGTVSYTHLTLPTICSV